MSNNESKKLFSVEYAEYTTAHEDKTQFRNRVLKYTELFLNSTLQKGCEWVYDSRELDFLCAEKMGIHLKKSKLSYNYLIEETFSPEDIIPIHKILDFLTLIPLSIDGSLSNCRHTKENINLLKSLKKEYIKKVNTIFEEEYMCYRIDEEGYVRYYPDEEFHRLTKSTLMLLNKPKYKNYLVSFHAVLDELYKNTNKESPVYALFKLLEIFAVNLKLQVPRKPGLDGEWVKSFIENVITNYIEECNYSPEDRTDILKKMENLFIGWIGISHKFRHGKVDQVNHDVPAELFNYIFSTGISKFRFLLQLDEKYNLISNPSSMEERPQD